MKTETGTIKWFDPSLKYGFIKSDTSDNDIFFHASEFKEANIVKYKNKKNYQGMKIKYTITTDPQGQNKAINILLLDNLTR